MKVKDSRIWCVRTRKNTTGQSQLRMRKRKTTARRKVWTMLNINRSMELEKDLKPESVKIEFLSL